MHLISIFKIWLEQDSYAQIPPGSHLVENYYSKLIIYVSIVFSIIKLFCQVSLLIGTRCHKTLCTVKFISDKTLSYSAALRVCVRLTNQSTDEKPRLVLLFLALNSKHFTAKSNQIWSKILPELEISEKWSDARPPELGPKSCASLLIMFRQKMTAE